MSVSKRPVYLVAQRVRATQLDGRIPPFGIMCVGEALRRAGRPVRLFHLCGPGDDRILEQAVRDRPPLFVGFSNCVSPALRHNIRLSKFVHGQGHKVVWGGLFPTAVCETTLRSGCVDYVVLGEGERPAVFLAEAIESNEAPAVIPGLAYLDHGELVTLPPAPFEPNLDNYPIGLDLVNWDDYIVPVKNVGAVTCVNLSRGCPFGCSFCTNSMDPGRRMWRGYGLDYIREMAAFLKNIGRIDAVTIVDDNPFARLKDGMAQVESLGFKWMTNTHLQYVSTEFLDWVKKSGGLHLAFGIESGSDRMLKKMNKKINREIIRERMRLCGEMGIETMGLWMAFMPGETRDDLRQTFTLMDQIYRENPIVTMSLAFYRSFPGTPFWEESLDMGLVEPKTLDDWADYNGEIRGLAGFDDRRSRRLWLDVRALYSTDQARNQTPALLRRVLRRRVQAMGFHGPLEEALHYARLARDRVRKITKK